MTTLLRRSDTGGAPPSARRHAARGLAGARRRAPRRANRGAPAGAVRLSRGCVDPRAASLQRLLSRWPMDAVRLGVAINSIRLREAALRASEERLGIPYFSEAPYELLLLRENVESVEKSRFLHM